MIKNSKLPVVVGVVLGVTLYEVGNMFQYLIQPYFLPTFFRLLGFLTIVYYLSRASINHINSYISPFFSILFVWTLIMVVRGSLLGNFAPGTDTSLRGIIQRATLSTFGAMSYFIPFIACIKMPPKSFYYLKRLAILLCVVALFETFVFREQIFFGIASQGVTELVESDGVELSVRHLIMALFSGYGLSLTFLFCFNYIKGKVAFIFPIAILVFFLSNAIGGGRSQTALNLLYLLLFFYIMIKYPINVNSRYYETSIKKTRQFTYLLLGVAFVFLLHHLYSNTEIFDYVLQRSFGGKTLDGEFINTSRDILKKDMFDDFNDHPFDWLWGRGVNGAYKTRHLSSTGYRMWMEWGYLYIILKGGVIYLTLIATCILHAIYLGLFKSRNGFSKGLAVMCISYFLNLASVGAEPQFSTYFLMVWICFGLLENKQIRMLSNKDIYGYFNYKNYIPQ